MKRAWGFRLAVLLPWVCVALSCDSEAPKSQEELDQYIPPPAQLDMMLERDARVGDDGVIFQPKEFGEPCESSAECLSGQCISVGEGGLCSKTCQGQSCPEGWGCRTVANNGADLLSICFPTDERLCKPCSSDGDCPAGSCLVIDGQSICGADCEGDEDCLPGYACELLDGVSTKQCVPSTGSCTCNPTRDGEERICERANTFGACVGRQSCVGEQGWTECDAQEPIAEICNQIDDDCNGFTDDIPMIGEVCTRETEVEEGEVIVCTGRLLCTSEDPAPICTALTPGPELCNFLDDDCDGDSDEDFPERDSICVVGQGLCQRYGVFECTEEGEGTQCNVSEGAPELELCDGLDNDCDGVIDNGFEGVGASCEVGQGLCRNVGVNRCSESGESVECSVVASPPQAELCDGLDNDCDGVIDNGFEGLNEICALGVGACQLSDFTRCAEDGLSVVCGVDPAEVMARAQEERCDGVDNDCDGLIDESFPSLFEPCSVGQGVCLRRGLNVCNDVQDAVVCSVTEGEPEPELCDGLDNDCNGVVDDSWPDLGALCEAGLGLCRRSGVRVCPEDLNSASVCNAERVEGVSEEVCDFQDDDCDGSVDEVFTDELGDYSGVANCGACGNDCNQQWGGDPVSFNVTPLCVTTGNSYRCDYSCINGAVDADGQARNGCELSPDPEAIYVSASESGGVDAETCGALATPCASITYALERAQTASKLRVRVSEGVYREVVTLVEGIELLGGHDRVSWVRLPNIYITQIDTRGLPSDEPHRYGVKASSIQLPTLLDGFVINSGSPLTSGNSYGLYITNSTQALVISNNRINSGDGGRGVDGTSGDNGVPGLSGGDGLSAESAVIDETTACGVDPALGGFGVPAGVAPPQSCGGVSTRGGEGGYSTCPVAGIRSISGAEGSNGGGEGGLGGFHLYSGEEGFCVVFETPIDARAGVTGVAGQDGLGGSPQGVARGSLFGGHWRAFSGGVGESGSPGGGGGGGGAAAGVEFQIWITPGTRDFGASGASGGNGGCGGAGGVGGSGGGGSFAVYVSYTTLAPSSLEELPQLSGNLMKRGFGGVGGSGGNGGGGGEGGLGGNGGSGGNVTLDHCSLLAGDGGAGGRGGHAGGGSGGNGGVSYDIFIVGGPGGAPEGYELDNQFTLSATEATYGIGGPGGNSSNTLIGPGQLGLDGESGRVGTLP